MSELFFIIVYICQPNKSIQGSYPPHHHHTYTHTTTAHTPRTFNQLIIKSIVLRGSLKSVKIVVTNINNYECLLLTRHELSSWTLYLQNNLIGWLFIPIVQMRKLRLCGFNKMSKIPVTTTDPRTKLSLTPLSMFSTESTKMSCWTFSSHWPLPVWLNGQSFWGREPSYDVTWYRDPPFLQPLILLLLTSLPAFPLCALKLFSIVNKCPHTLFPWSAFTSRLQWNGDSLWRMYLSFPCSPREWWTGNRIRKWYLSYPNPKLHIPCCPSLPGIHICVLSPSDKREAATP